MKALSIKPPWAYYIIYGVPFGVSVDLGEGKSRVDDSGKVILKNIENRDWPLPVWFKLPQRIQIHVGKSDNPWFVGKYGFTLSHPVAYEKPIPTRGRLGFWEVELPLAQTEEEKRCVIVFIN